MKKTIFIGVLALALISSTAMSTAQDESADQTKMVLVKNITGRISPKSVLSNHRLKRL
jgi:protein involved in sex pheromone biosynthesis